jgi:hypothetical protein
MHPERVIIARVSAVVGAAVVATIAASSLPPPLGPSGGFSLGTSSQ